MMLYTILNNVSYYDKTEILQEPGRFGKLRYHTYKKIWCHELPQGGGAHIFWTWEVKITTLLQNKLYFIMKRIKSL